MLMVMGGGMGETMDEMMELDRGSGCTTMRMCCCC